MYHPNHYNQPQGGPFGPLRPGEDGQHGCNPPSGLYAQASPQQDHTFLPPSAVGQQTHSVLALKTNVFPAELRSSPLHGKSSRAISTRTCGSLLPTDTTAPSSRLWTTTTTTGTLSLSAWHWLVSLSSPWPTTPRRECYLLSRTSK